MSQRREHRIRKLEREQARTAARLEVLERHDTQTALDVAAIKAEVVTEEDLDDLCSDLMEEMYSGRRHGTRLSVLGAMCIGFVGLMIAGAIIELVKLVC